MRDGKALCAACRVLLLGLGVLGAWGCALKNGFLDPTIVGQFPVDTTEGEIRRVLSPRETPAGLANATDPTPEDLVVSYDEYRIGPSDILQVQINDLITPGQVYGATVEVNSPGEIRIPELGSLKVAGMTEQELEQDIKARLRESEILPNPVVVVILQTRRARYYNIIGSVVAAGQYPITQPDMRLLDAIGMARDIGPEVKKIYVIRRNENGAKTPHLDGLETMPVEEDGLIIPPPMENDEDMDLEGLFLSDGGLGRPTRSAAAERNRAAPPRSSAAPRSGGRPPSVAAAPPRSERRSSQPNGNAAGGRSRAQSRPDRAPPPSDITEQDLEDVLAPDRPRRPVSRPAPRTDVRRESDKPFAPLIFDPESGRLSDRPEEPPPEEPFEPNEPGMQTPGERPFDWEDVPEYELTQRVIAIDVPALKTGDPRFNIVVRDRDVINVPVDTGVFYLMGQVNRPGVFQFNGREITIKHAIAIAGGFAPLGWPATAEVIRREPGTDKQITMPVNLDAIFAGLEADFYLRDDDIVNVGSSVVAPFLYVVRNSFRFTYGFGFVYDRNFADKDAYNQRPNPEAVDQLRRSQRGLPF